MHPLYRARFGYRVYPARIGQITFPSPGPIAIPFLRPQPRGGVQDRPGTLLRPTRCKGPCTLYSLANETSAPAIAGLIGPNTALQLLGVSPGWVEVTATILPPSPEQLIQNVHGFVRSRDLVFVPAGAEEGATPGGGGGTTTPAGGGGAGTGTGTATAQKGTDPELTGAGEPKSTLSQVGEFLLLTSPAWGSFLLSRLIR